MKLIEVFSSTVAFSREVGSRFDRIGTRLTERVRLTPEVNLSLSHKYQPRKNNMKFQMGLDVGVTMIRLADLLECLGKQQ